MNCINSLHQASKDLMRIMHEGQLADARLALANALRGMPRTDREAYPQAYANAEGFGKALADWTGLPEELCRYVAIQDLLPINRVKTALETLREYANQLEASASQATASTIMAAERRRAGR